MAKSIDLALEQREFAKASCPECQDRKQKNLLAVRKYRRKQAKNAKNKNKKS